LVHFCLAFIYTDPLKDLDPALYRYTSTTLAHLLTFERLSNVGVIKQNS